VPGHEDDKDKTKVDPSPVADPAVLGNARPPHSTSAAKKDGEPDDLEQVAKATIPQQVQGPLGAMTVVPDSYTGPRPAGAVSASDYQKMRGIITGIGDGNSQVKFDTSFYTKDLDPIDNPVEWKKAQDEAAAYKAQYMGYLTDLVKTPTGLMMLEELHQSEHSTTIGRHEKYPQSNLQQDDKPDDVFKRDDGSAGPGSSNRVYASPETQSYVRPGETEQPWMTEMPKFGFYHELVHSYYSVRGEQEKGFHKDVDNVEWMNLAQGPYSSLRVNENQIRKEMGKDPRPHYDGKTY
jgi:hypothetical protein